MNVTAKSIEEAALRLKKVVKQTPLEYNKRLSEKYKANIYFKREDQQEVRSFKIRGSYNKMASMTEAEKKRGVVCASAGNHAQGVALSCSLLKVNGTIFMPTVTPNQKIQKVKTFGGKYVKIELVGDTFDEASKQSQAFCKKTKAVYVHPFNDPYTISGQGTVGKEIWEQLKGKVDMVITTVGGGGLMSGTATYLKSKNPKIEMIGLEPTGAAAMYEALKRDKLVELQTIDTFVDGAAVKQVGDNTFKILHRLGIPITKVDEGRACNTMIELYQNEGIITEPAGILPVSGLEIFNHQLKGKTVVCVISGGNNDILRYPEIRERGLIYQGRKHYFIVNFAQKPGQLKTLVSKVLGPNDDIVRFEYIKKTNAEKGPAFIGIQLQEADDLNPLIKKLDQYHFEYQKVNPEDMLYKYLV